MMTMTRRHVLLGLAVMSACAAPVSDDAVSFDTAKAWANAMIDGALSAAAEYVMQPKAKDAAQVHDLVVQLLGVQTILNAADLPASKAKATVAQVVTVLQKLDPLLGDLIPGKAKAEIATGLALLQAFVSGSPAPAGTPATPPEDLQSFGARARLHHA